MIKCLLILSTLLFFDQSVTAQSTNHFPVFMMSVNTTHFDADIAINGFPDISDTTLFHAEMKVALFDTVGISKLHVKVGSTLGGIDIFQKSFAYDNFGIFTDSTSYNREGYNVDLGLGNHIGLIRYFAQLILERVDGTMTSPVYFKR